LLDDLELQEMRWLRLGNALYQVASAVNAPDRCPHARLDTFRSDRMRQQHSKRERRTSGNFLVKQEVIPDGFRITAEADPSGDGFLERTAREEPTHEPVP
jgi:hypothetical protein